MTLAGTCGLQAEQQLVLKTMKPLYPKPHRNQLLEGLRPALELNTFHRWPGVSCSPLPQGLHQALLPSAKVEGLSGETTEMSRATSLPWFQFIIKKKFGLKLLSFQDTYIYEKLDQNVKHSVQLWVYLASKRCSLCVLLQYDTFLSRRLKG